MMLKKLLKVFSIVLIILSIVYYFRISILRSIGNFLIISEHTEKADVIWLIDYNLDCIELLYKNGMGKKITIFGNNGLLDLKALGIEYSTADTFKMELIKKGIPEDAIFLNKSVKGFSEEMNEILAYCNKNDFKSVIVPIEKPLTRNFYSKASKQFEKKGIRFMLYATEPIAFNMDEWWKNEYGLLCIYGEYMKILYHFMNLNE